MLNGKRVGGLAMPLSSDPLKRKERRSVLTPEHLYFKLRGKKPFFRDIVQSKQYRNKPKRWNGDCHGFDTETENGYARVLASDDAVIEVKSFQDVLDFLTQRRFTRSLNTFYNLQFDAECLLKWDKDVTRGVAESGESFYDTTRIRYIKGKLLRIAELTGHGRDGKEKRRTYTFYDAAQFYRLTLANAAQQYLGKSAMVAMKEDRARLFQLHKMPEIMSYCQNDALLTKELTDRLVISLRAVDLETKRLTSSGQLSQIYALQNSDIPKSITLPRRIADMYWEAFHGGWFDTYKKGTMPAWSYDIKSAYPFYLSQLPDVSKGDWYPRLDEAAEMGVIKVLVTKSPRDCLPLAFTGMGCSTYFYIDEPVEYYMTYTEFFQLEQDFGLEPLEFYAFSSHGTPVYPYKTLVDKLFTRKEALRGDDHAYRTAKELINSLYGKTCEKRKEKGKWRTGRLFNPCYATETTARTRMQIYKDFHASREDLISVATDGVFTTHPINVPTGINLGDWSPELTGQDFTIIQTGIYESKGGKTKARGLMKVKSLREKLDSQSTKISIDWVRPMHQKECIRQDRIEDIGCFMPIHKEIDILNDKKRMWLTKPKSAHDLLDHAYGTHPIPISILS